MQRPSTTGSSGALRRMATASVGAGAGETPKGGGKKGLTLTDVPGLGDLTGQPQVWIALLFSSNSSINYDNVS